MCKITEIWQLATEVNYQGLAAHLMGIPTLVRLHLNHETGISLSHISGILSRTVYYKQNQTKPCCYSKGDTVMAAGWPQWLVSLFFINTIESQQWLLNSTVSCHYLVLIVQTFNTLRLGQNGHHFADNIFKLIFLYGTHTYAWNLFQGLQLTVLHHWFR